jgi:hypothetical protein
MISNAQQSLKFKIEGLKDTTVFLARYFGDRLYYADTTESKKQNVVFNTKNLVGGVYAVVCPGSNYFEFVVTNEDVVMETDLNNLSGSMKVIKSENNKIFYNYITYLNQKKNEAKLIRDDKDKMAALDKEVKEYQRTNILEKTNFFWSQGTCNVN